MTLKITGSCTFRAAAIIAIVFGLLTIFSGGSALFGGAVTQEWVGSAVGFVLWFNFLSGFAYVAAGVGILLNRPWAAGLSIALALAITAIFAAFGWHIYGGGAYEMRTVGAMLLRAAVWIGIAVAVSRGDKTCAPKPDARQSQPKGL